jgi:hypothetical protein
MPLQLNLLERTLFVHRNRGPARVLWLAIALGVVALFAAGVPAFYRLLLAPCLAETCELAPTPAQVHNVQAAGLSLADLARFQVALVVFFAAVHVAVAGVIFWRRPADRVAWFIALTLLTFGTFGLHDGVTLRAILAAFHPGWRLPVYALMVTGATSIVLFYFILPDGRLVPRGLRWPALTLVAFQALVVMLPGSGLDPSGWPVWASLAYWAALFGTLVWVQFYHYRRISTIHQRQQTKWVVFGIILALAGALGAFAVTSLGATLDPRLAALDLVQDTSYYPFLPLVPLSIGVAIMRSRLWDIDVLIRRMLIFSVLTAVLALGYFGTVLALQGVFRAFTGQGQNSLVVVLSTLAIAALFGPVRSRVQAGIDRRFFRQKYGAARNLASFAASARHETDLAQLSTRLVDVVEETMQPVHVGLWLRKAP